ncbi:MAG TPA: class I SAM-dependent methyltransferase [Calditerricola sp.]
MAAVSLSKRLYTLARFVPPGSRVADIGADHAQLPVYLVQTGRAVWAVATDVHRGPWEAARAQVARHGLEGRIDVRLGDGLSVLEPGEADVLVLAGMGGPLIVRILTAHPDRLRGVRRLVLQPNTETATVRRWLREHGFCLVDEELLEEDGRLYEVLVAEPGDGGAPYRDGELPEEELLEVGPHLWRKAAPLLVRRWEAERNHLSRVCAQLARAKSAKAQAKRAELQQHLARIDRWLSLLRQKKAPPPHGSPVAEPDGRPRA